MPTTFEIDGLRCESCVQKVRKALAAFESDTSVTRNPDRITVNGNITREQIANAVASAGDFTLGERIVGLELADASPAPVKREMSSSHDGSNRDGYIAFATLVGFLIAGSAAMTVGVGGSWMTGMAAFMGLFFLAFSFFKLLRPAQFAASFARYDLIAASVPGYGRAYPLIELALGLCYLLMPTGSAAIALHAFTLAFMFVGGLGVVRSLRRKDRVRCACLGTVIDLPLGTVTLVEDFGMAAMAGVMLV